MSANAIRSPSPFVPPIQTHRLCPTQCLLPSLHTSLPVHAYATYGLKSLVRQNKHAPVVGLQVVDLLPEQQGPEVLADKFDAVERRLWPWSTGAEPVCPIRQIPFFETWSASFNIQGPRKGIPTAQPTPAQLYTPSHLTAKTPHRDSPPPHPPLLPPPWYYRSAPRPRTACPRPVCSPLLRLVFVLAGRGRFGCGHSLRAVRGLARRVVRLCAVRAGRAR